LNVRQAHDHVTLDCTGHRINATIGDDGQSVFWTLRTTSWDFAGDRSDIHDVIGLAVSAVLAAVVQSDGRDRR
jgi:hypothetical protein